MNAVERQLKIREMLESKQFLDLGDLCRELGTSRPSLRRDLLALESQNVLKRVHGGAVSVRPGKDQPFNFETARTQFSREKSRIAKLAAGLVSDGQTVVLDGGSTVAAVARELVGRSLQVVTNSLPIAEILLDAPGIELTLTGGYLHPPIRVMLGPLCEQMLSAVRADMLIMGIGSITETGLSNNNTLVVGSERKMIEISSKVVIVADHSKFGRGAMIPLAPLDVADVIISDDQLPPEYQALLTSHGIELLLA